MSCKAANQNIWISIGCQAAQLNSLQGSSQSTFSSVHFAAGQLSPHSVLLTSLQGSSRSTFSSIHFAADQLSTHIQFCSLRCRAALNSHSVLFTLLQGSSIHIQFYSLCCWAAFNSHSVLFTLPQGSSQFTFSSAHFAAGQLAGLLARVGAGAFSQEWCIFYNFLVPAFLRLPRRSFQLSQNVFDTESKLAQSRRTSRKS